MLTIKNCNLSGHRDVIAVMIAPPCSWWRYWCCFWSRSFLKDCLACCPGWWRSASLPTAIRPSASWWTSWRWSMPPWASCSMDWCRSSSEPPSGRSLWSGTSGAPRWPAWPEWPQRACKCDEGWGGKVSKMWLREGSKTKGQSRIDLRGIG